MSSKSILELCPCGSKQAYDKCCERFILGREIPTTAEQLMRSRYTAYTQANIDYIQATMRELAAENFDPVAAESWAKAVKWKRLKVYESFSHPSDAERAFVSFSAYYIAQGRPEEIREVSEFKRIDGRWFYISRNS